MMDMFLREVAHVTQGPLKIIRFGSCGSIDENVPVGTLAVAQGSVMITRDFDAFSNSHSCSFYRISQPCPADDSLTQMVLA